MKNLPWNLLNWAELQADSRPFFLYDLEVAHSKIFSIRSAFKHPEKLTLNFSVKSNPHPIILQRLMPCIDGFDVSAEVEIKIFRDLNLSQKNLSFSGPGKTDSALKMAKTLNAKVIQLDSTDELLAALSFGLENFSFRLHLADLFSNKLGFSENELIKGLQLLKKPALGLHLYLGRESFSQVKMEWALNTLSNFIDSNRNYFHEPRLFIGPGISPQFNNSENFSFDSKYPIELEVGRGIISAAGCYAAQILARKKADRGADTLIINGGLQHLGGPFITATQNIANFKALALRNGDLLSGGSSEFVVAGSLCLSHDILHPRLVLPDTIKRGDWIIFPNSGAYGLTAGVPFFIGQDLPREFLYEQGQVKDITRPHFQLYQNSFRIK